ncbi:MAG: calcium/proton exchanger [Pyrinomonadaceae bacterium]
MIFLYLLLLIPFSLALAYFGAPSWLIFVASALAIVPLAEWIRRATEQMTHYAGSVIGGLLNVTFGNMAELILAIFVLMEGKTSVVKATITGSIIGNSLLGLGLAILVGSWKRDKQTFKRERAGLLSSLLILSVIALMIPALFNYTERDLIHAADAGKLDEYLSLGSSVVLILVYAGNLIYTLVTHKDVFAAGENKSESHKNKQSKPAGNENETAEWSWKKALLVLIGATAAVAVEADLVSGALEKTAATIGLTTFFMGIIVLPMVGNAAEYFSAIYFARQNQMGLVMSIAVGSSIQVALLTAPLLVLLSYLIGHPMTLVFSNPLELIAIAGVAFAVNSIAQDGETTWFEGLLLLAVYLLLAMAFFWVTL